MPPTSSPARPATAAADPTATARAWLSLGPASRLVGVDPDTLRRWADAGRLPSFTTPGGHRRFDRHDLERIVRSRASGTARRPLADLGATPGRLSRAYARSYRDPGDERSRVGDRFGGPDRDAFRSDGRRLLAALMAYLDAGTATRRGRAEAQAVDAVRSTGARLALGGASVEEAVQAYLAARRPFLAEIASLGRRRSLDVAALTGLYDEAVALLDRLLIDLLAGFREAAIPPASPAAPASPAMPATASASVAAPSAAAPARLPTRRPSRRPQGVTG